MLKLNVFMTVHQTRNLNMKHRKHEVFRFKVDWEVGSLCLTSVCTINKLVRVELEAAVTDASIWAPSAGLSDKRRWSAVKFALCKCLQLFILLP